MPARRFGPYEVVGPLAAGGMGEVLRARDPRLGRDVAIKVLPAAFAGDPDRLARFEREARAVGQLSHPNVLAVFDVGTADGAPYLVTELLEGETLRERLHGRPVPVRKAVDFVAQAARGLAAAHEKGVVHRDLKPDNLFVTRDGRVKILDFGLAKLSFPQLPSSGGDGEPAPTEPGLIVGTAGYMSPEQVKGLPADPRSDIFSLGTILLEMLTGKRQFSRGSLVESLNAIVNDEPEGLASGELPCSPVVGRIARRCLEKNPDERYQSARDLAFALEEVSLSLSGVLPDPGAMKLVWYRRLHWRWLAAAVGTGVLGLVSGLWLGWRAPRPAATPAYQQLTFRRGTVWSARFAAEGETVLFGARWEGQPLEVFLAQPGQPEARPLQHVGSDLLAVSRSGAMLLSRDRRYLGLWVQSGTLARASLTGGEPRDVLEDVEWADFGPNESEIAIVRRVGGQRRLELPIGTVLHESTGWISHPRVAPDGASVAFLEHPVWFDDGGSVVLVDRSGTRTVLDDACSSVQGLAWARDGTRVVYTAAKGGATRSLYAVAPGGRPRLVLAAPISLTVHDVATDGTILLAREQVRAGVIVKPPGGVEHDLSWLDYSVLRDFSPDGHRVLFTEGGQAGGEQYGVYLRYGRRLAGGAARRRRRHGGLARRKVGRGGAQPLAAADRAAPHRRRPGPGAVERPDQPPAGALAPGRGGARLRGSRAGAQQPAVGAERARRCGAPAQPRGRRHGAGCRPRRPHRGGRGRRPAGLAPRPGRNAPEAARRRACRAGAGRVERGRTPALPRRHQVAAGGAPCSGRGLGPAGAAPRAHAGRPGGPRAGAGGAGGG